MDTASIFVCGLGVGGLLSEFACIMGWNRRERKRIEAHLQGERDYCARLEGLQVTFNQGLAKARAEFNAEMSRLKGQLLAEIAAERERLGLSKDPGAAEMSIH